MAGGWRSVRLPSAWTRADRWPPSPPLLDAPAASRLGAAPRILASLPPSVAAALSKDRVSGQCQPNEQQGGGTGEDAWA